jgi:transcriptional regulator with XRE-family HTH domain
MVVSARAEDNRRLVKVERVLEHLEDPEPGLAEPIPRRLRLVAEDLRSEFEEAWSRLLGRTLVDSLKRSDLSLRTMADRVSVSAPYLSQLSAGGGPVPSARILTKLREGHDALGLPLPPHEPTPSEVFREVDSRASAAREHLKITPIVAHRPRVTVDHPANRRMERTLRDCFEAIAERYVDDSDGAVIKELVELLVSADQALLSSLAWVTRDERAVDALHSLRRLAPDVRQRFLELLSVLTPAQLPFEPQNRLAKKEMP